MREELEKLKDHCYRTIQISYNSDGRIKTKNELKPRIRTIVLNKLDYALELLKYNSESENYIKTLELKELLMNEKH